MMRKILSLSIASLLLSAGLLIAQSSSTTAEPGQPQQPEQPQEPQQPSQPHQPSPMGGRRGNAMPCWQEAGLDKSVLQKHAAIEREARSQVASVCANSSLTPQQKRQQVHEIRVQAKQKTETLATPEQRQAFFACRQARGQKGLGESNGPMVGCGDLSFAPHPAPPNAAPSGNESENPPADQPPPQNPPQR